MRQRDKILLAVLVIMIFVAIGGICCTYFSTGVIDLIWTIVLAILVFVTVGAVMCSRSNG